MASIAFRTHPVASLGGEAQQSCAGKQSRRLDPPWPSPPVTLVAVRKGIDHIKPGAMPRFVLALADFVVELSLQPGPPPLHYIA
jgi:hypothetical protein